jgi:hypothetical protein
VGDLCDSVIIVYNLTLTIVVTQVEVRSPTLGKGMDSLLNDVVWDDDGEFSQEPRNILHYNRSTGKLYVF